MPQYSRNICRGKLSLAGCKSSLVVAARRLLNDLPDELWTKISMEFYKDAQDAFFNCILD